jgi:hypothetical protein
MLKLLVLTTNAHLELAMRLSALAEGVECHANAEVPEVDAVLVDLDELYPELADLARHYGAQSVPVLGVAQDPAMAGEVNLPVDLCLAKPVESMRLVYVLRQLASLEALSEKELSEQGLPHTASADGGSPERA